jgi:prepilin-type N-terminal cleavage/methylation domain-containing protein
MQINKSHGYTLMEVMVGVAIGGIVALSIATIFDLISRMSVNEADAIEAEKNTLQVVYMMKSLLAQSVNIRAVNVDINNYSVANSQGRIRQFNGASIAGRVGQTFTIAIFNRETASSAPGATASDFSRTGIFYQMPTPNTSGVLYFQTADTNPVRPTRNDNLLDRIVHFDSTPIRTGPNNEALSMRFRVGTRYFRQQVSQTQGGWCPAGDNGVVAGCSSTVPFHDIFKEFVVTFRNNGFPIPPPSGVTLTDQGIYGSLYFFRPLSPAMPL